ncbi:PAS domain S-box protein [Desulfosarcina sp. OttesenSCG-928-A07]|nr:PAS domain S-box protein [Desulfosarcina sp. OttesenSCG-928-G17]MDL2328623.1 PAS domain S-box protein [Desulfosarcina sp. OttesenSCG-928-A07]
MIASFSPIWWVDVAGSLLMIIFAFISLGYCLRLRRLDAADIVINYLFWVCGALSVFAISRSVGHLLKQMLLLAHREALWLSIQPISGAVNTCTFIVVASVTLFFERNWKIYGTIVKDRHELEVAHEKLLYLNQHLEQLAENRSAALVASEHKYRQIFEVSKDMILVTHTDGQIITINPAGRQLMNEGQDSQTSVEGKEFQQFLSGPQDWYAISRQIQINGSIINEELDLALRDGTRRRVLLSGSIARTLAEEAATFHFLIKDIQQRQLMQKQMAQADKLASIGEFASGIAHEINNPLGIILGYTQLLLRSEDPAADQYQDLKTIEKHVQSCKTIVEDLLNFARTSAPSREKSNIHAIITDTIRFVRHHGNPDAIQIETDFSTDLPFIRMDEKKIKQVMINLLTNAIHAVGDEGRIRILTRLTPSGDAISVAVADTGHGIPKENLTRIFDPFFTTKPTGKGTGLGLSVSYGIIKGHGGQIQVDSEVDKGSIFTFLLPVQPVISAR